MSLSFISSTLTVSGEIMIAYTVISVHHRVMKEHKIDAQVFAAMRREQTIAGIGIGLIVLGYIFDLL